MNSNSLYNTLLTNGHRGTNITVSPSGFINVRLRSGRELNARSIGRMIQLIQSI